MPSGSPWGLYATFQAMLRPLLRRSQLADGDTLHFYLVRNCSTLEIYVRLLFADWETKPKSQEAQTQRVSSTSKKILTKQRSLVSIVFILQTQFQRPKFILLVLLLNIHSTLSSTLG